MSCYKVFRCCIILILSPWMLSSHSLAASHHSAQFMKQTAEEKMQQKKQTEEAVFLENNAKKEGVISLESGLQYKILKPGTGGQPKDTDSVRVHYEGKLLNGRVFDSSWKRGEPITFSLRQVIKGWQQGLVRMKEGAEWMLYVPAHLAYGHHGVPGVICPDEMLIFKVQLIAIEE